MPFESGSGHSRRALSVAYQGTAVITAWDIGRHQLRTADHIAMSTAEVPSAADIIGRHGHPVDEAKPFKIPKREDWEAFKRVKANQGAAGVDGQSIADFEGDLSNNLYKLWNRLSSGSYLPPPVKRVDIPKANGGTRPLGIPTVADRVAQEVARRYLEPILELVFHANSYGYRPGKSAIGRRTNKLLGALAFRPTRRSITSHRCWKP